MAKYQTIVVDPPWPYEEFYSESRNPGVFSTRIRKALPYPSMLLEEIAGLPLADLADTSGAFLWYWTTNRYLPFSFQALDSYGFKYRQTLVWRKVRSVTPFGGSVAPNHAEYLLLASRGQPKLVGRAESSVVEAPGMSGRRTNAHSRKPECFIDLIEQVSPAPRVELFARRARFGWDYWGDESLGTAEVA